MENQSQSEVAGAGDGNKESKDENANVSDSKDVKKETKEKGLREKIKKYLESNDDSTQCETRKDEMPNKSDEVALGETRKMQDFPQQPCNYFNDFGTCKYKSGHFSKSGTTNLIHICRFCYGSYGKKNSHPESLCAQLKTHGDLLDHGIPLKLADLNTGVLEKGTDEELGVEISAKLQEPKVDMIVGVVGVIGRDAAVDIFKKTQKMESDGGMMVKNGTRRRTAGGTFLQLLRENPHIDQENIASFFNKFNGIQVTKTEVRKNLTDRNEKIDMLDGSCDYLNDFGSCKYKAGHLPKSGLVSVIDFCRFCFAQKGEKNFHPKTDCHLNPNTALKPLVSSISCFNNDGVKPKSNIEDHGDAIRCKSSLPNLLNLPEKVNRATGPNAMWMRAHPGLHGEHSLIHESGMGGRGDNRNTMARSMASRLEEIADRSTPRSRLVQTKGNFGKNEKVPQIGKSTPKSRLSESMENYMSNVGSKRDGDMHERVFSCMGRTSKNNSEFQDRGHVSQGESSIRKDQKMDAMKASINQIIGCLNRQKIEFPEIKQNEENGLSADISYNCQIKPPGPGNKGMERGKGERQNPFIMSTSIRDEPWLAAYNIAKQKAVHNLENGNLQSVSGISGYCGEITNTSHLTANSQISKLMVKMKMEGMKESGNRIKTHKNDLSEAGNKPKIPEKKSLKEVSGKQQFGIGVIAGRKLVQPNNPTCKNLPGSAQKPKSGLKRSSLNPAAAPFSPTAAHFNPLTPPPFLHFPYKLTHPTTRPIPTGNQASAVGFSKGNQCGEGLIQSQGSDLEMANGKMSSKALNKGKGSRADLDQNEEKKKGTLLVERNRDKTRVDLSNGRGSSSTMQEARKKYDYMEVDKVKAAILERSKEKGKSHCPCPPYCPPCLENLKARP